MTEKRELLELREVLEKEKEALMSGMVDEIIKYSSHKLRLIYLLKNKEITPEERELLRELYEKNEKNKKLIQAGLNFVDEAYKLLSTFIIQAESYGTKKVREEPHFVSKVI